MAFVFCVFLINASKDDCPENTLITVLLILSFLKCFVECYWQLLLKSTIKLILLILS